MSKDVIEIYSIPGFSEPVSCITYVLGGIVFSSLAWFLLRCGRGHWGRMLYLSVFAFASVFLLSVSAIYHLLSRGTAAHAVLLRLDCAAIFVLIAATFTVMHGMLFTGLCRWEMIVLIWMLAATLIAPRTILFASVGEWLALMLYFGIGSIGAVSVTALWRRSGLSFIQLGVWGSVVYALGAILNFVRQPVLIPGVIGPHELFHVAVLVALGCHWYFVFKVVAGPCSTMDLAVPRLNRSAAGTAIQHNGAL